MEPRRYKFSPGFRLKWFHHRHQQPTTLQRYGNGGGRETLAHRWRSPPSASGGGSAEDWELLSGVREVLPVLTAAGLDRSDDPSQDRGGQNLDLHWSFRVPQEH